MPSVAQLLTTLGAQAGAMRVDQVQALLHALVRPVTETETLPLHQALGRVLAQAVISPVDVPPHDNAAMDGYAFASSLLAGCDAATDAPGDIGLPIAGTVLAGQPWQEVVPPGQALRIMTGAMMPPGLDTVVPFELCQVDAETQQVRFAAASLRAGANRRQRGEELAAGATALAAGTRLGPAELGLVAGLGLPQVCVRRRLRVALFSTGDEILQPGDAPRSGAIYDSNRFALAAALQQLGCEVQDLGAVADEPAALRAILLQAAQADAIITSGGVSSGDADHTQTMLAELGDVAFLRIAMRPGRPLAAGRMQGVNGQSGPLLLGLPGNPVAALLSFALLARPALLQAMGMHTDQAAPAMLQVPLAVPLRKRAGRTEFVRATLVRNAQGRVEAHPTGNQSSAMLSSLVQADALLWLAHAPGDLDAGTLVDALPLHGLF
ncbi:gephyrin-like molybdotransferase Glp [Comamonas sp. GB3 AK4-5]|uniref:molybdopterin molybdotransferase MoeA n=1 Tax=Comamonas sp. GB3 AK4-5 TaxID=3231487 RepID=UPI00351F5577